MTGLIPKNKIFIGLYADFGMEKEEAKKGISGLIQLFKDNIEQYKLSTYKEAQVRKEKL